MTIMGDFGPIKVANLDIVGYIGDGKFIIISPFKALNRDLPKTEKETFLSVLPMCIPAIVENNQEINFSGKSATLHDISGEWHLRYQGRNSQIIPLQPYTFFEIGNSI